MHVCQETRLACLVRLSLTREGMKRVERTVNGFPVLSHCVLDLGVRWRMGDWRGGNFERDRNSETGLLAFACRKWRRQITWPRLKSRMVLR